MQYLAPGIGSDSSDLNDEHKSWKQPKRKDNGRVYEATVTTVEDKIGRNPDLFRQSAQTGTVTVSFSEWTTCR